MLRCYVIMLFQSLPELVLGKVAGRHDRDGVRRSLCSLFTLVSMQTMLQSCKFLLLLLAGKLDFVAFIHPSYPHFFFYGQRPHFQYFQGRNTEEPHGVQLFYSSWTRHGRFCPMLISHAVSPLDVPAVGSPRVSICQAVRSQQNTQWRIGGGQFARCSPEEKSLNHIALSRSYL